MGLPHLSSTNNRPGHAIRALLAAAIVFATAAAAGQFEDGVAAIQRGDYETAYRLFFPLAEQGNAQAQFNVGLMYSAGRGIAQDDAQAASWYRKAADQGLAPAQGNLGLMYVNGRGVPQSDSQAVYWLRKAAEQGNAPAQNDLGTLHVLGRGLQKDDARAYYWFLLASAQGHATATQNRNSIEKRLSPEQQANVRAEVLRFKPTSAGSTKSAWDAPVAAQSEMVATDWAGFNIRRDPAKPATIEYGVRFRLKHSAESPQLAVISFENTEPRGAPIVVEQVVAAGAANISVASPPLAGISPGRVYAVTLTLYSDSTKATAVATHTQQIQAPDVPADTLSNLGIKIYK